MSGTQVADEEKARLAGEAVREAVSRYGKVHSEVVKALEEYARCQHKIGNHAESLQAARRAAEISNKLAGEQTTV